MLGISLFCVNLQTEKIGNKSSINERLTVVEG